MLRRGVQVGFEYRTPSGIYPSLDPPKETSPLRFLTNCETRVQAVAVASCWVASKKKKTGGKFLLVQLQISLLQHRRTTRRCLLFPSESNHSSIVWIIWSRVHRGGSKRAAELKAVLGEQRFRSSSAIRWTHWQMSRKPAYLVGLNEGNGSDCCRESLLGHMIVTVAVKEKLLEGHRHDRTFISTLMLSSHGVVNAYRMHSFKG